MAAYFDRYSKLRENGEIKRPPFIKLKVKNTDKFEIYKEGFTRLDIISQKYYRNPHFGWLILLANSNLTSLEFKLEEGTEFRIPFPLESTLDEYNYEIDKFNTYYGL